MDKPPEVTIRVQQVLVILSISDVGTLDRRYQENVRLLFSEVLEKIGYRKVC